MDQEIILLSKISQTEKNKYMQSLYVDSKRKKKLHKWTYLQNRKRLTDTENKLMITKRKREGEG